MKSDCCLVMKRRKCLVVLFILFFCFHVHGQGFDIDDKLKKIIPFVQALRDFSNNIPQEKVYLHFDNTSYYQGDHIWFKCYVTSALNQLSDLSKTLYVELLNPGGEMVDKRILKIENGACHGDFTLSQIPFYSGFYEVRAYTKYMLNFGDEVIFSRLLPVFNKPKTEGNFEEKEMMSYGRWGTGTYPMKRESPERGKAVNVRFFPEGGNLIQGVASQVAFEATDQFGNPIDITGVVMNESRLEVSQFSTQHEGRGVFTYTPAINTGKRRGVAEVEYGRRKYQFDLPVALPHGVIMEVDNTSHPDSIGITLRKNGGTPSEMLGVTVLNGGKLQNYCFAWIEEDEISFQMNKTRLPSGVSQIVLFNSVGEILCDRLIFTNTDDFLDIKAKTSKPTFRPFELVDMELSVTGRDENPVQASFSLSVRDGENEVESSHNILTDLLLMSEIKGYVRHPSYYFENNDEKHRAALDLLLMVQGWRRYSWKQMAGVEPFELKYFPEQGIETHGNVFSYAFFGGRQIPKPNVDVSLLLQKRTDNYNIGGDFIEIFETDSLGRFSFVSDVEGRWNMILTAREKGKPKNYMITLDRVFNPDPKRYRYADFHINVAEKFVETKTDEKSSEDDTPEDDYFTFLIAYQDSIAKLGMDEKVHQLSEVTITAKKRTKEQEIYQNKTTSVAYYDVTSEMDDIYDRGNYVGNNIHELLKNMNKDFSTKWGHNIEWLLYKNKMVLFVIDYEPSLWTSEFYIFKYKNIRVQAIKSIYINETLSAFCKYFRPESAGCAWIFDRFGCVIFIETWPDGEIPVEGTKGIRKTWLEGYSRVSDFYSPDYSELPLIPDYRRTLYWNPSVTPDENGKARIQFYNNSRSNNFSISAETVTLAGKIGVYRDY